MAPTCDQKLIIDSSYGQSVAFIHENSKEDWAQSLVSLVQSFFKQLPEVKKGLHIKIESTFEGAMGMSSSTSVTAAIAFGIMIWCFPDLLEYEIKQKTFNHVMQWIADNDQSASGAAHSVLFGKCRYYDAQQKISVTNF